MQLNLDEFILDLDRKRQGIESALAANLPGVECCPPVIHKAMRYAVLNGGKRIRPIMVLEAAAIGGMEPQKALKAACAMEYIHCYSLVHDDLPAMDNDDLRRGKPTCHIVYGEDIAILTGDALLTLAFEIMAASAATDNLEFRAVNRCVQVLARAAGSRGMIGGQVLDLQYEQQEVRDTELDLMHSMKTGQLFAAALMIGATLAGMPEDRQQLLRQYAANFGMAFQITDDILDVCGSEALMGKPVGSDRRNEKNTYISIFGVDRSREMARDYVRRCLENLQGFGPEADFLRQLALFTIERQS